MGEARTVRSCVRPSVAGRGANVRQRKPDNGVGQNGVNDARPRRCRRGPSATRRAGRGTSPARPGVRRLRGGVLRRPARRRRRRARHRRPLRRGRRPLRPRAGPPSRRAAGAGEHARTRRRRMERHPLGVLVVTDDMPFLVDTMRMVLERHGLDIHLLVHPMLAVARDDDGTLVSVGAVDTAGTDDDRTTAGRLLEAWTQIEIDRTDGALADELEAELVESVDDVHRVVDDFEAMRHRLQALADVDPIARWLGRRPVRVPRRRRLRTAEDGAVTPLPETGLGQLRAEACRADTLAKVCFPTASADATPDRPSWLAPTTISTRVPAPSARRCSSSPIPPTRGCSTASSGCWRPTPTGRACCDIPGFGDEIAADLRPQPGTMVHSHTGRATRTVLESLPRDLVLELSAAEVADLVGDDRRPAGAAAGARVRGARAGRAVDHGARVPARAAASRPSCRRSVADTVAAAYGADQRTFESYVGASSLARIDGERAPRPTAAATADLDALERAIDELTDVVVRPPAGRRSSSRSARREGRRLFERVGASSPPAYLAAVAPERAIGDMRRVGDAGRRRRRPRHVARPRRRRRRPASGASACTAGARRLRCPSCCRCSTTSASGPRRAAVHVPRSATDRVYLYDIGVRVPDGRRCSTTHRSADVCRRRSPSLVAGEIESDGFNRLVLRAGLDAREVDDAARLRASTCARSASPFSQPYIEATLAKHAGAGRATSSRCSTPASTRARPADRPRRDAAAAAVVERSPRRSTPSPASTRTASAAAFLDADRRHGAHERLPRTDAARSPSSSTRRRCPTCRCRGRCTRSGCARRGSRACTCAAAPIARGGIRWSDRREDFRTEVLGLMKAQMVKNAVIVPTGAKGGFVVKRPPPTRTSCATEVVACYRAFIGGLLDVTDNLVGGAVVHPPDTVVHDGDDPYLVVAADKGTATFSDIANEIAAEYGFWLGDAFASGGSVGLRPQGDGHHRPRRVGERAPPRPRARQGRRPRPAHRRRHRRHVGRRVRQRHAALAAPAAGRRVRPPPRVPRSRPRPATVVRRAPAPVRPAPLALGRLRPGADLAGRRRVPAHAEVDRAQPPRRGPRSASDRAR